MLTTSPYLEEKGSRFWMGAFDWSGTNGAFRYVLGEDADDVPFGQLVRKPP